MKGKNKMNNVVSLPIRCIKCSCFSDKIHAGKLKLLICELKERHRQGEKLKYPENNFSEVDLSEEGQNQPTKCHGFAEIKNRWCLAGLTNTLTTSLQLRLHLRIKFL